MKESKNGEEAVLWTSRVHCIWKPTQNMAICTRPEQDQLTFYLAALIGQCRKKKRRTWNGKKDIIKEQIQDVLLKKGKMYREITKSFPENHY